PPASAPPASASPGPGAVRALSAAGARACSRASSSLTLTPFRRDVEGSGTARSHVDDEHRALREERLQRRYEDRRVDVVPLTVEEPDLSVGDRIRQGPGRLPQERHCPPPGEHGRR